MAVGLQSVPRGEPLLRVAVHEDGTVYVAIVHGQRRDVHRTRQFLVEPLHLVVHTDTHIQVEGRHEVGVGALVVGFQASRELRVGQQLQRVVPVLGGLQTHLRGQTDEVFVGLELIHRVGGRCLEAQFHLQLVVPLPLRLVVVVGLQRQARQHRVVALAAFVPVARHVVLQELQEAVALEGPEVGLLHLHVGFGSLGFYGCGFFGRRGQHGSGSLGLLGCRRQLVAQGGVGGLHQVGTAQIHVEQRVAHLRGLTVERKGLVGHAAVVSERKEKR